MRKIIMFNRISLDGYYTTLDDSIDWFIHDHNVDQTIHTMMNPDTLLTGRHTYQLFESYWPHVANDPNAPQDARKLANELNQMTKIVFSTTLQTVTWENSVLLHNNLLDEVQKLKQANGTDIVIFGGGTIVQQLTPHHLIDEYLIVITPVILGSGKSFFQDVPITSLNLLSTQSFPTGNILLHYGSPSAQSIHTT